MSEPPSAWKLQNGILDLPDDCFGLIVEALNQDSEAYLCLSASSPETMLKLMRVIPHKLIVSSETLLAQLEWLCLRYGRWHLFHARICKSFALPPRSANSKKLRILYLCSPFFCPCGLIRRKTELSYLHPTFRLEIRGCRSSDLARLLPALRHVDAVRVTNREAWTGVARLLHQAPALQILDFSRATKITDASVQQLQSLPALLYLDLTGCVRLTDESMAVVGSSLRLRYLDVTGCTGLTPAGLQSLVPLASCLETLTLCGCTAVNDASTYDIARLTSLTHIDLSSTHMSDVGLGRVLDGLTRLVSIECQGCPGLKGRALRQLEKTTSVRRVNVAINLDLKERSLRHLKQLPELQSLAVNFCLNIGDYALTHHISELTSLTFLDLSACVVCTDLGLQRLAALTALRVLKLGHLPNFRGPGLACLEHMPDIQELLAPGCKNLKINGRGLCLREVTSLRVVDFTECRRIQNDCIRELPPSLQRAIFQDCDRISDESLEHMAWHWPGLMLLDLTSSRNVTDRGVRALQHQFGAALDLRTADCPLVTQPKKLNPLLGAVRKFFSRSHKEIPGAGALHGVSRAHGGGGGGAAAAAAAGPSGAGRGITTLTPANPGASSGAGPSTGLTGSGVGAGMPRSPGRSQNPAVPSTSVMLAAQQNQGMGLLTLTPPPGQPIFGAAAPAPANAAVVLPNSVWRSRDLGGYRTPRNLTPRTGNPPAGEAATSASAPPPPHPRVSMAAGAGVASCSSAAISGTGQPSASAGPSTSRLAASSDHEVLIIASEGPPSRSSPRPDVLDVSLVLDESTLAVHGLAPTPRKGRTGPGGPGQCEAQLQYGGSGSGRAPSEADTTGTGDLEDSAPGDPDSLSLVCFGSSSQC